MKLKKILLILWLFVILPFVVSVVLWSKDLIQWEYYTYRYEKKIDQIYDNYLLYWPSFFWKYRDQFGMWEDRKEQFYQDMEEYYIDINNKKIYRWDSVTHYSDRTLITWVDYDTFTPLGMFYARDKNYIYYEWVRSSYDVTRNPRRVGDFIADDEYVYHNDLQFIVTWANAKAFHNITWPNWWGIYYSDNENIYADWWIKIDGVNIQTFQLLGLNYAKDKNNIYRWSNSITWADIVSFIVLGEFSPYVKDKNNVYIGSRILTWVDVASFEIVDINTAKDNNHTYKNGKIVE